MILSHRLSLIAFLIFASFGGFAQDLNFSQFYELPLLRNPALAGVFTGDVRVQGVFRNQWQAITVPYRTEGLSGEIKFPIGQNNDVVTIGLQLTNDEAGDSRLKRTQFLPVINYHKSLNGDEDGIFLSTAFMGGFVDSQFDPSGLKWGDQFVNGSYSASNPTNQILKNTGKSYFDLSTGVSFNAPVGEEGRWYAGVGLYHFNRPNIAFDASNGGKRDTLNSKWAFNIGLTTPIGDENKIILYGDYFLQGGHRQFLGGGIFMHDLYADGDDKVSIGFGTFYRWDDAVVPVFKLDLHQFGIGLSYDVNVSKLNTASQSMGGFELTMNYKDFLSSRNSARNHIGCKF
jgi:type IX secretion system PorP/SprF family membrane protein